MIQSGAMMARNEEGKNLCGYTTGFFYLFAYRWRVELFLVFVNIHV